MPFRSIWRGLQRWRRSNYEAARRERARRGDPDAIAEGEMRRRKIQDDLAQQKWLRDADDYWHANERYDRISEGGLRRLGIDRYGKKTSSSTSLISSPAAGKRSKNKRDKEVEIRIDGRAIVRLFSRVSNRSERYMRVRCPVRTGKLKRNLFTNLIAVGEGSARKNIGSVRPGLYMALVGSDARNTSGREYAVFVERYRKAAGEAERDALKYINRRTIKVTAYYSVYDRKTFHVPAIRFVSAYAEEFGRKDGSTFFGLVVRARVPQV